MFLRLVFSLCFFALLVSGSTFIFILIALRPGDRDSFYSNYYYIPLMTSMLFLLPAMILAYKMVLPLKRVIQRAEQMERGDYKTKLNVGSFPESSVLAQSFNRISDQMKERENQLENDRKQLEIILQGMMEGVIALDADQRILFINDSAIRMLDLTNVQIVDRFFWEVCRQSQFTQLVDSIYKEKKTQRVEIDFKGPQPKSLVIYSAPLPTLDNLYGTILVGSDTSELKRLENVRQEFVANVSHELKTQLSVIKGSTEALLDGALEEESARLLFLTEIQDQSDRLHTLILDLLSLARIESGEQHLEFQGIDLVEAVDSCLKSYRSLAEAKEIHLQNQIPRNAGLRVWADEEALGQILDNLVNNALKYTQNHGQVQIHGKLVGQQVEFTVEDNGPGIPERDTNRIFERFYRVDKARSRELGGTGLGLAIVKHLTQGMNGTVRVMSQLGSGSKFIVTLPRDLH